MSAGRGHVKPFEQILFALFLRFLKPENKSTAAPLCDVCQCSQKLFRVRSLAPSIPQDGFVHHNLVHNGGARCVLQVMKRAIGISFLFSLYFDGFIAQLKSALGLVDVLPESQCANNEIEALFPSARFHQPQVLMAGYV